MITHMHAGFTKPRTQILADVTHISFFFPLGKEKKTVKQGNFDTGKETAFTATT